MSVRMGSDREEVRLSHCVDLLPGEWLAGPVRKLLGILDWTRSEIEGERQFSAFEDRESIRKDVGVAVVEGEDVQATGAMLGPSRYRFFQADNGAVQLEPIELSAKGVHLHVHLVIAIRADLVIDEDARPAESW